MLGTSKEMRQKHKEADIPVFLKPFKSPSLIGPPQKKDFFIRKYQRAKNPPHIHICRLTHKCRDLHIKLHLS